MRVSSVIYKNYNRNKRGMGKQGQQLLTATEKIWRVWKRLKFSFCSSNNAPTQCWKSLREGFDMKWGWPSPNKVPLWFCNLTNPHRQSPYLSPEDVTCWAAHLCGFEPWEGEGGWRGIIAVKTIWSPLYLFSNHITY